MLSSRPRALFCAFLWPLSPGHSGGEIRDFHLVRHLSRFLDLEFFALHDSHAAGRVDPLRAGVRAVHTPASIAAARPDLLQPPSTVARVLFGAMRRARQAHLAVPGRRYHVDAETAAQHATHYSLGAIVEAVRQDPPDYLIVSPQLNPLALLLRGTAPRMRQVLASYDVEQVRMQRIAAAARGLPAMAQRLEARRAAQFERDSVALFDGIIAVSPLDRTLYLRHYGLDARRVTVVDNSVDAEYFAFQPRTGHQPPRLLYVGNFGYPPNAQAALRLLRGIVPRIRSRVPDLEVTLAGASPTADMRAAADDVRAVVTGRVADVRPFLAAADVACFPLVAGSGTKYKVLEALAAGVPVVGSPLAVEGLEVRAGEHLLVAEQDAGIADAVVETLAHPAMAGQRAQRGRALVEARYAWDANLAHLEGWLQELPAR